MTLAAIAPKLGKLIRLLASDRDGEALAAARGIGRTLEAAGLDFHALADVIDKNRSLDLPRCRAEPAADMPQTPAEVARWCLNSGGRLTAKERDFLSSMLSWRRNLTARQTTYLEDLVVRCGGRP